MSILRERHSIRGSRRVVSPRSRTELCKGLHLRGVLLGRDRDWLCDVLACCIFVHFDSLFTRVEPKFAITTRRPCSGVTLPRRITQARVAPQFRRKRERGVRAAG